jgi:K+-sensing histidine kinase KdpD
MERIRAQRDVIAFFCGLALPIVVAAVLVPFRTTFATTAAALVLVAVVVAVAANGSRLAGLVAAASASLWFDFFLTEPYERFAITHRSDVETAISLFVVGVAVTELAAHNRRHHRVAVEETDFVGLVYYLSELVASDASVDSVIERATDELTALLNLRACRYETGPAEQRLPRIDHDGNVYLGEIRWDTRSMGLPGKEVELLVQSRGHDFGRLAMAPTPGWPVSAQRLLVAIAIADQVGAAMITPQRRSA